MIISNLFFCFSSSNKTRVVRNEHFTFCYLENKTKWPTTKDGLFALPKTRTTVGSPPSRILKWLVDARAPIRCVSRSSLYGLSNKRSHLVKCAAEAGTLHHRLCHGRRRSMSAGIPFFSFFFFVFFFFSVKRPWPEASFFLIIGSPQTKCIHKKEDADL